jgi:two-component system sensor histidine kinase VicK
MIPFPKNTIQQDIETIGQIPIVDNLLQVICEITGMRFASLARITGGRWVACAVRDIIGIGVEVGTDLVLEDTLCHGVYKELKEIVIDHVAEDPVYVNHHMPVLFGFQSYISIPIFLKNREFFGVICALDPLPAKVSSPQIIGMFNLFAELIAFHIGVQEDLAKSNTQLNAERTELATSKNKLAETDWALQLSKEDLQLTVDSAGLATWDYNPVTGRFNGNDLIKAWFGLAPENDIDLQIALNVIVEADRERVVAAIQQALDYQSGGDYRIDYTIVNPLNPTPRVIRARGKALFNADKQAFRLSGVLQDVTEEKADEQRKDDFINMVSHELKTPLTSLAALIQLTGIKVKKLEDNFLQTAMDKAYKQVNKMTALINGFLNVSRLQSGKISIEPGRFDLSVLVEEAAQETVDAFGSHHLVFEPMVEAFVYADREKIGQVVNNLVSNAVKYSPGGSTITVSCTIKEGKACVSVSDQGSGIYTQDLPKLFDRYYRVREVTKSTIAGFGIGLYLCNEIINRHNGAIWADSVPGEGSTFYFSLALVGGPEIKN